MRAAGRQAVLLLPPYQAPLDFAQDTETRAFGGVPVNARKILVQAWGLELPEPMSKPCIIVHVCNCSAGRQRQEDLQSSLPRRLS